MERRHVLLVTFPAQGHINPSLQFAKRLINMGIEVTFATSESARRRMAAATTAALAKHLTFVTFSDEYDDGFKLNDDAKKFMTDMASNGSRALKDTILTATEQGRPVTCLVYTLLLPWASEVARELHVPHALLWNQAASVLSIYYHYFNGFADEIIANSSDPTWRVQIPGTPLLSKRDLPSFLLPSSSDAYTFVLPTVKDQFKVLDEEITKPKVLVNTFDALEADALGAIDSYDLIGIGPLIPSAFHDGQDQSDDKSFGGDLFEKSDDYVEWLNSKPESSVVYVSFGSILSHKSVQMEEIANGLLDAGRPFLWVIREDKIAKNEELGCLEDLKKIGRIVRWCSQLEVLTHPSVGCFLSHCGWNSILESLSCGVPVVAFPHWTDQGTNAMLIEDVWGTGVRVRVRVRDDEDGIVESGEIRRCVEEVMDGGPRSVELRVNADKWKGLAREAVGENGSSTNNLKAFFD